VPDEPLIPESSHTDPPAPLVADDSGSLADHEARYKDGARQEPTQEANAEPDTPPAEQPDTDDTSKADVEADDYGPRDDKGKFLPRKRHRAQSQEATPADVPRIQSLTARLRAVEAERDALRARAGDGLTTPAAVRPAPPPPIPAPTPKPTPDKFDDYSAYIESLTDWKMEQALAAAEQKRAQAEQQHQAEQERQRITKSWTERVAAAKQKYPDYAEVALESDTAIPQGSLIDAWILEHKTGAEMLYHFQRHPDEVQAILAQPVLEQAESLALLAQRFNGQGRPPAVATGSAATSSQSPPPKPPNPVRTGPVRAGDEPPDPEKSSLADHEKWYAQRKHRGA
jgi:hypothetical protein